MGDCKVKARISSKVESIWKAAVKARKMAHAPYSKFFVGAAFDSGSKIYSGCNIENASFGAGLCAERVAIFKSVSEGRRPTGDLVVVTEASDPTPPCGMCLQVMAECCAPNLRIWLANPTKILRVLTFSELLPHPFVSKGLL